MLVFNRILKVNDLVVQANPTRSFTFLLLQVVLKLIHFLLQGLSEVFEGDDNDSDVVETALGDGRFKDLLDSSAAVLVDGLAPVFEFLLRGLPPGLDHLYVVELVVDTVTPKHDIIVVILYLEAFNVWCCDDNLRVALILGAFGLYVAKCARDGQPAWEDAMRSQQDLLSHLPRLSVFILHFCH